MTERKRYNVGAVKIPHERRDIAHAILTEADDRGYRNIIGADDHVSSDSALPLGENVCYRVELTEEEAELFRSASNCRYVEEDILEHDAGTIMTPAASSMRFMRADFPRTDVYHGRDVLIGMLDGGSTAAARNYLGVTMVAKQTFGPDQPGADEITSAHGCLVLPCLVPPGGRFLDAIVSSNAGTRAPSDSVAAGRWCADQGAKIINYSGAGATGNAVWTDMLQYLKDRGIQFFASAGNDGLNQLYFPAAYSTSFSNCHSSISFDENTGARSTFSCHDNTGSGCAPGTNVFGLTPGGVPQMTSGTSMSAPHMALLCAMGCTGNRFTPTQVGAALKANTRNTGQPAEDQGAGAYDLQAALTALGGFNGLAPPAFRRNLCPNPSFESNSTGYSAASGRTGITVAAFARFNTIPTPFGSIYGGCNITGNGTTNATPDAIITLPTCPVEAGKAYTFSGHLRTTFVPTTAQWQIVWQNDAGTVLGTQNGIESPLFLHVWGRHSFTGSAPAGATKAIPKLLGRGFTDATARSFRVDGFMYEQASSALPYFDGQFNGSYEGTANNSTSIIGTPPTGGGGGTTPPPGGGFAANLYVAPTGSDSNPGTSASAPKLTIAAALTAATAGQTISVAPGSYPGITSSKGGTAGNHITIRSATKWGAKLTTDTLLQHQYLTLQDFEITGASTIVYACDVTANNVTVKGNHIHDIARTQSTEGTGIEIYSADGNYSPMSNVLIEGNWIHGVGAGVGDNQLQQGIYFTSNGNNNCVIRNNVVYDVADFGLHGYTSSGPGITSNWIVVNNTVSGCGRGILTTGACTVRNNISYNNLTDNYDIRAGGTLSNNLSGGTGNTTGTGITAGVNPLFVNAAAGDFRLQATSPAINAGIATNAPTTDFDGKTRPLGGGYDIGAFEFGSTTPTTPPPDPGGGGGQGPPPEQEPDPGEEPEPSIPKRVSDEVMEVLYGRKGKREWRFRYELLTASNTRIRDLGNVLSGSVSHDFFAEIKRTAKFTLRDDGSINFLTQRIRPWVGVRMPDGSWQEWSQGVFLLTTPNKSVDISNVVIRDVEAYDQTMVLVDDTVTTRYFVGANVEYTEAIQELLQNTPGIPSFSIQSSTTRTPAALEWEPGTSKLRIISDLLSAINYGSLWFDGNGTLKAGPYTAPSVRDADFHYETNDVSVILADAGQELDLFQIPNRWVLIVSNPDQPPLRAEIKNDSPLSPTSTINRGRIITRVVTDVEAPNQAVLNGLAERLRDEDGQVFETVTFETGLMPFHENADVYDFIHYGLIVSGRFMETKWSLDLQQGASMKHEARRTVSVLGGFGIGPFGLAPFGA